MVDCRSVVRFLLVGLAAGLTVAAARAADESRETARQLWTLTDLVLAKHITPPSRQEMLLAAVRSMTVNQQVAADLGRRISDITTPEQLAPVLRELWPQTAAGEPADAKKLFATLGQAMLRIVPGNPELIPADQHKVLEQISHNRYVGIGVQLAGAPRENLIEIVVPFPGGPARKAGARPGDLILEIDGVNVAEVPLGKVVDLLRGEDGTKVNVVVRQKDAAEKRTLHMTRGVVPFTTLLGYRRTGEEEWNHRVEPAAPVAYVRVSRLTSSAVHELRQIERRLQADGCRAVILDLRFTHDGDLQQGLLTADALLESGVLGKVRDRHNNVKEYKADPDCLFRGWPLAVLVSPGTRGAGPELLATALQANGRAVLVGEPTRGEAYVATSHPLPDDLGVVRLPTAVLERPALAGGIANRRDGGMQVDHVVVQTPKEREAVMDWNFSQEKAESASAAKAPADSVLAKAVELLKAKLPAAAR